MTRRTVFSVLMALFFLVPLAQADETLVVISTPHSYKALVERLNQAVKKSPVNIVSRASATVGVKNAFKETIPGNMVVGVYGPHFAKRMLEASIPAGIEAPIRFYITENADGTASLSYKTPSFVFSPYSSGNAKLVELASELDAIFAQIANEASAAN